MVGSSFASDLVNRKSGLYTDLVRVKLNFKFTAILHGDRLKSLTLHVGAMVLPWLFHKSRIQMIAYLGNSMNVKYCNSNWHIHAYFLI